MCEHIPCYRVGSNPEWYSAISSHMFAHQRVTLETILAATIDYLEGGRERERQAEANYFKNAHHAPILVIRNLPNVTNCWSNLSEILIILGTCCMSCWTVWCFV